MEKGLFYACVLTLLSGCSGSGGVFSANLTATAYSGYVAVASGASNTVSLYDAAGNFVRTLRDLNSPSAELANSLWPSSVPGQILLAVSGVGRIESLGLADAAYGSVFFNSSLSPAGPRGLARDSSGNYFVSTSSYWTVEKFTSAGFRVGAPFIPNNVSTCTLTNPYSVAVMGDGAIAVGNASANSIEIYESDGSCRLHLNTAPFNANSPRSLVYDSLHDKLIVALYSNGAIYAVGSDGTGATLIYQDTTIVANPSALAVDASGNLYVGSTSQDTIEKFTFDGTTATRVGTTPFISARALTLSPSSIVVVP